MKILVFVSLSIALSAAFECGMRKVTEPRGMINGEQSYAGQWPWLVTLHAKMHNEPERFFCVATIINEWSLVTGK